MNHFGAGRLQQKRFRQKPDKVVALDKTTGGIEEEATIKVAVPSQPDIGTGTQNRIAGRPAILFQQRVGYTIGEIPIWLMVNFNQLERQL